VAEPRPSDSFILRFEELAQTTPLWPAVDVALRALDTLFSLLFLLLSLPLRLPLSLVIRITSGPPLFYRGERVGRSGRVFTMLKFRTTSSGSPTARSGSTCARSSRRAGA
jgi:lipopolysaccharide/colanic/teichoic acid biosynthesis glycosyltransferase